jgi:predicted ATP-dependent endonuclease of OLD family
MDFPLSDGLNVIVGENNVGKMAMWEARSSGRCLFVMPSKLDWTTITAKIRGTIL